MAKVKFIEVTVLSDIRMSHIPAMVNIDHIIYFNRSHEEEVGCVILINGGVVLNVFEDYEDIVKLIK